jgi:hypothetical protein
MNVSKHAALPRVESACRDIDVLRFDFELTTAPRDGPRLHGFEQHGPGALPPNVWRDSNVPENSKILTVFQHRDIRRTEGNDRSANESAVHFGSDKSPT